MDHEIRQQYITWLQSENCQYFFTGTFRDWERSPNGARRALERFFGAYENKPEFAFLCIEKGDLYGRVHTHGLLRYPEKGIFHPAESVEANWRAINGIAMVESIRTQEAVSGYVSKYITKDLSIETYIILP